MASLPPAGSGSGSGSDSGEDGPSELVLASQSPRSLPRRASLRRPELRAALALEEAGELQEAARVLEHTGEHAQAALLRMEHARTVPDVGERIDVLREGCARNPGDTEEGRALHLELGRALLDRAIEEPDPSRRRALELEAARGFEEADEGGQAGELYERLGLLDRAARAYERAGEIVKLELVLEVLERHEQAEAEVVRIEAEVDRALEDGRRRQAHVLLLEHAATRERLGTSSRPGLARRLAALEAARPRPSRIELQWNGRVTTISGHPRFLIGRAPDAHLTVPGARLSRHHVELSVDATDPDGPRLMAVDLGSKVGTFWDGEPLEPGEPVPLQTAGELGLGASATVDVVPLRGHEGEPCGALLRSGQRPAWHLFLPQGGPLVLAPEVRVPARVLFDRGWVVLDLRSGVLADLHRHRLPAGAVVELLVGDRLSLVGVPLALEVLS
ncbi:FHA domain-containing protein [Paraliomyxa miuraensis]|uniref:FHA domain-containing protein n=1 Tax=Paraliomyxa miuraensis TaxID=376150 RepID=UPI002252A713|nr:FHA domain-containing protein [Paraliomyxa miuraensis]MCX4242322.1 FHA domain-containing protein [Paraliomyxa miuraensis]